MLSDSIINTYSAWKNNESASSSSFETPHQIQLPKPKYTNNPLGMGSQNPTFTTPYLSNNNLLSASSVSFMPVKYNGVYGNYVIKNNKTQPTSVVAEHGSNTDTDSDSDSEFEIVEVDIETRQIIPIDSPAKKTYVNLDDYKLNDPIIQFYFGSITVIGLFILFRIMSKTK